MLPTQLPVRHRENKQNVLQIVGEYFIFCFFRNLPGAVPTLASFFSQIFPAASSSYIQLFRNG